MSDLERLARVVVERAAGLKLYARQWLDAASAEDVVQEALAALLSQRPPPDDPIAWMYRSVRNAAIDHARSTSRRRRRERSAAITRRDWFEPRPDSMIDAKTAEDALRHLSLEHREVVVLRIWADMGLAEIGRIVGTSTSTVHNRYASAMQQLRMILEKPCPKKIE